MPIGDKIKKQEYINKANQTEQRYGLPTNLLVGLLKTESGLNPNAVSSAGARGIAQFMPATAKAFGIDPHNVDQAIDAAGKYLSENYKKLGNWDDTLRSYNMGLNNVYKWKQGKIKLPKETAEYTGKIYANMGNNLFSAKEIPGQLPVPLAYNGETYRPYTPPSMIPTGENTITPSDTTTEESVAETEAKAKIDKVSAEQEMMQDYFAQNQVAQAPQQQAPQQQEEATPSLLDQYAQVSQFVDNPIAQEGGVQQNLTPRQQQILAEQKARDDAREAKRQATLALRSGNAAAIKAAEDAKLGIVQAKGDLRDQIYARQQGLDVKANQLISTPQELAARAALAKQQEDITVSNIVRQTGKSPDQVRVELAQQAQAASLANPAEYGNATRLMPMAAPDVRGSCTPGMAQKKANAVFQTGGFIKDNRGQWAHPGQNTEISSPHITMKGVDYPVLGISKETGEQKIMMPNLDYYFNKTQNVQEIPLMQQAGIFNQNFLGAVNPTTGMVNTGVLPAGSTEGLGTMLPEMVIQQADPRFKNAKPKDERNLSLTKKDNFETAPNVNVKEITKGGEEYKKEVADIIKQREQQYKTRSNDLDVMPEHFDAAKVKTPQDVKSLQQKLVSAGYNLNPEGKFQNNGIDGKLGKVTKQAIEEYNLSGEKGKYTSFKDKVGEIGNCKESQCSEYVQNEIYRNLKPNVDRDTWNAKTGLTGDAWRIGENVINRGGKQIPVNKVREGDIITMHTGTSPYEPEARKYGTDATHVGVVDKVNPDGSYYILHNLHEQDRLTGEYRGRENRHLVTPDGRVHITETGGFTARAAYRPNYDATDVTGKTAKVREDVGLQIDPQKAKSLQSVDKSLLGTNVAEKANMYLTPLNSIDNKRIMAQKHNLSETEYQSLAKAALGVMGQETGFGTSAKASPKEAAANILSSMELKQGETSRGASQLKYRTNYGNSDLTEFGINQGNFTEDKNVPLVTMDILAKHYKSLLKTGIPKEQALYKAVEKYNRGHNTKYSDTGDSDYANKVMHFADMFSTVDKAGTHYNTLVDKMNLNENTVKKQKSLAHK